MTNKPGGTLYIGVTSNLVKRVHEHKLNLVDGFTKRYGCHTLVYYEVYDDINAAILQEKQIKKWNRAWKLRIINERNVKWKDLDIGFNSEWIPAFAGMTDKG